MVEHCIYFSSSKTIILRLLHYFQASYSTHSLRRHHIQIHKEKGGQQIDAPLTLFFYILNSVGGGGMGSSNDEDEKTHVHFQTVWLQAQSCTSPLVLLRVGATGILDGTILQEHYLRYIPTLYIYY